MFLGKISRIVAIIVLSVFVSSFLLVKPQKSAAVQHARAAVAEKVAVTPSGYDDIGDILSEQNITADEIQMTDLADITKLKQYEVVYINCSKTTDDYAVASATALSQYVKDGGIIYASDYANSIIQTAFPGKINFYGTNGSASDFDSPRVGSSGKVTAKVVDSGLAAVLGKNMVNINFDLGYWAIIDSVASGTTVHVTGPSSGDPSAAGLLQDRPYVVSFSEGSGEVLYTSFHNEAQKTDDMEKLVNWFTIRTRASNLARLTESLATKNGDSVLQEVVDKINKDESKEYTFQATGKKDFSVILNFGGSTIKATISDPSGKQVASESVSSPPYSTEVAAKEGKYTIKLEGKDIPSANYPFVLAVAGDKTAIAEQTFVATAATDTTETTEKAAPNIFDTIKKVVTYVVIGIIVFIALIIVIIVVAVKRNKRKNTATVDENK